MVYLDYEAFKAKYLETQRSFDAILQEKEELFARTQPNAVRFDKERVSGGKIPNPFEDYMIAKEKKQIDQRLAEAKSILDDRERLLRLKEAELRASKAVIDRVYVLRYIERMRVYKIMRKLNYSERQIYRMLETIEESKHGRK